MFHFWDLCKECLTIVRLWRPFPVFSPRSFIVLLLTLRVVIHPLLSKGICKAVVNDASVSIFKHVLLVPLCAHLCGMHLGAELPGCRGLCVVSCGQCCQMVFERPSWCSLSLVGVRFRLLHILLCPFFFCLFNFSPPSRCAVYFSKRVFFVSSL